jgi:hypothetical protein
MSRREQMVSACETCILLKQKSVYMKGGIIYIKWECKQP